MADTELRANSLRVRFEHGVAEPSDAEIFNFMKAKMGLRGEKLLSMYKEKSETSVIIKFKNEEDMRSTLRDLPDTMIFEYNSNQSTTVKISAANAIIRYVRLFNLPPEVEDRDIATVMSKFGKITRLVRERYSEKTGFPIWTSVRGIYLELKEGIEMPATLHIRGLRARVFYEGLVNKCFVCGSREHLKVNCPQKRSVSERLQNPQQPSYSGMVKGDAKWTRQRFSKEKGEEGRGMVSLGTVLPHRPRDAAQSKTAIHDLGSSVEDGGTKEQTQINTSNESGGSTNITIAGNEHSIKVNDAGGGNEAADADQFITVTSKRGRKHANEEKADTSDSDLPTTESNNHDCATVAVPRGERISEATDRCTRSRAKQIKLAKQGECSSSAACEENVELSPMELMDGAALGDTMLDDINI